MSRERGFHGGDEAAAFDWRRRANQLDVPLHVARALYDRAMQRTVDERHAEELYACWLRAAAASQAKRPRTPDPGRTSLVTQEVGEAERTRRLRKSGTLGVGETTRVLVEATPPSLPPAPHPAGLDEVQRLVAALASNPTLQPPVTWEPPALRGQLLTAAESGRGAAAVLAGADSATAAAVLRGLRDGRVHGQVAPVLRLVARNDEAARLFGRGSAGRGVPAPISREQPRRAQRLAAMDRAQRVREVARMQRDGELAAALRRGEPGLVDALAAALRQGAVVPHPVDMLRANARGLAADARAVGRNLGKIAAGLGDRARQWAGGARAMALQDRDAAPDANAALEQLAQAGGEPLPLAVRIRMEALFGHRFAHVRVHTDAAAVHAAAAAGARALTLGSHIYFAPGEFAPGSEAGDRLLLHELTHVVQHDEGRLAQPESGRVELSSPSDATEREARAMESRVAEVQQPRAPLPAATVRKIRRTPEAAAAARADAAKPDAAAAQRGPTSEPATGKRASANVFGDAAKWVGDRVEDVEHWAEDKIEGLVATVAPGLATLIKEGPGGLIKDALEPAIKGWVATITGGVNIGQVAGQLKGSFASAFAVLEGAKAGDEKCCNTLVKGIEAIRSVASAFMNNPVMDAIKGIFTKVSDIVGTVTKLVVGPVFDLLKSIVGPAWDAIKSVASTVSGWISKVKSIASKAFDWVAKKLGFSSATGEGGLTDWIQKKAVEVWDKIKSTLAPVIGPLKVVAGALLLFTGLPQIYAIMKYGPQLVEAVQWMWANRNNPNAAKENPGLLGGTIFPKILGVGQGFVTTVKSGVTWLVQQTTALATGALNLAGAVTGVPLLSMATGFVHTLADGVKSVETWAEGAFTSAEKWLEGLYKTVSGFLSKYGKVLTQVAIAVTNPAMIPVILAGEAWQWLPDCIKPPLIDLLLDAVIAVLRGLPMLPMLGPLWPLLKAGVIGFLEAVKGRDAKTKTEVSNKLAKIISGGSPMFLFGFVKGLLKGVWDGIKMPFEAIWMVAKGIQKAGDFFAALGSDAEKKASPATAPGTTTAPGAATTPKTKPPLPGVPSVITPDQASSVVGGIASTLVAQKPKEPPPAPGAPPVAPAKPGQQNEYKQLAGEAKRMGGELEGPGQTVATQFWPAVQELFAGGGKSMSLDDLIAKLSKVWQAAKGAVASLGAKIANMIVDFLMKPDAEEEIGEGIGYMVGMIAFQALLDYLSAGTWTGAMGVISAIAKFLNWPMEFLGEAMKALKALGGFILDGLKSLGSMVAEASAGALREVMGAFREIGTKLGEFAEELAAKFRGEAEGAGKDAAGAVEKDAAGAAEKDAATTAEDGAKGEGKGEGKNKGEGEEGTAAEQAAEKAEELAEAIEVSKLIATAEQAGHVPGPVIALSLDGLETRYRWIKDYEAEPVAGGFDIYMIASKHHIKRVKDGGLTAPVDLEKYLPEGFTKVGDQISVDMSQDAWRTQIAGLPKNGDYLYVVRNAETGEVMKVGSTSKLEGRLKDYKLADNTSVAHGGNVTVDIVQVKKPPGVKLEVGEGGMRDGVMNDATEGLANPNEALPWDKSGGRGSGPGTPGNDAHNMKYDLTKWDADAIVDLPAAERNQFVSEVNAKYGAPPSDIAEQLAAKSNAEIARTQGVPAKVVRLWRNLVEKGLL